MDNNEQLVKPKGSPDLVKLVYRGLPVLLDHTEKTVIPLASPTHSLETVMRYLVDEGFLVPVKESESPREGGEQLGW